LLTDRGIRAYPELAALGHWFRAARLEAMARAVRSDQSGAFVIGRGLAFHLAPANVDSVSVYSWMLSLLAGNTNIVRVSQKLGPQVEFFLNVLREIAAAEGSDEVARRFAIVTYPHDEATTRLISLRCQLRVVWGGDATVATIRAVPLRPTAVEYAFPDRFSLAAIDARRILDIEAGSVETLARGFYNDAFWFAQQACSSPRAIYWIGAPDDCTAARGRFWKAVEAEVRRRDAENSPAMAMARLTAAFEMAGAALAKRPDGSALAGFPLRLDLERDIAQPDKDLHCGNGIFLEAQLSSLPSLAERVTDREQTLSVFGFERSDVEEFLLELPPRAIDRIVPIGSALDFSRIWDGIDLIEAFTRRVEVTLTQSGGSPPCSGQQ